MRAASTGSLTDLAGSRERTLLFRAVAVACGARAACFLVAFLTTTLVPVTHVSSMMRTALAEPFPATSMLAHILHPWAHWDGVWYIRIASQGYVPKGSTAFFPLYPLALRVTAPIVDHNYVVAGILLSLAFYAAASVLLFKLVSSDFTPETAFWTVLFLAVSPASFFFQAVYTESVFLLATVACFYFARQHRWAFAGLAGMAATLTRSSGLVLIVPLAVMYMQQRGWRWRRVDRNAGWLLLIPAGLGVWMAYLGIAFGNPLRFVRAETLWNRHLTFPLVTLWRGMLGFEKAASHLLPRGWAHQGFINYLAFAATVFFIWAIVAGWRRLPASYTIYAMASLILPLMYPTPRRPFESMPRFLLVSFPVFVCLALVTSRRRWLRLSIVVVCVALLVWLTAEFALFRMVA